MGEDVREILGFFNEDAGWGEFFVADSKDAKGLFFAFFVVVVELHEEGSWGRFYRLFGCSFGGLERSDEALSAFMVWGFRLEFGLPHVR
jgi:hypothetical protein